ncbi:MAG: hypothetical protein RL076_1760 [Chloroflexota bacterium]|jgi:predicted DNA-binding helix-hairpin-helix protein
MDVDTKLDMLAHAAGYEACDSHAVAGRRYQSRKARWSDAPLGAEADAHGVRRPVLRLLMSAECIHDCPYCPLRAGNDVPRATLTAQEVADTVAPQLQQTGAGLLLSTAVTHSADAAGAAIVDGAQLLRTRHDFRGYMHLKLPPGVSHATVEAAARVADRLSINIEVPSAARQAQLDATRDWRHDVVVRLRWMRDLQQAGHIRAGIATQFVVGVAGESDRELLTSTAWLRSELGVGRVYYGAFRASPGTPMANAANTPAKRTQRLLQADWLLRHYGFAVDELVHVGREQLPLAYDPKLAWAMHHPERFPIEINSASYDQLLRIPGMGPLGVKRVLRLRTLGRLREPAHIAVLGAAVSRICDFVTFDGRFFGTGKTLTQARRLAQMPIAEQLTLF